MGQLWSSLATTQRIQFTCVGNRTMRTVSLKVHDMFCEHTPLLSLFVFLDNQTSQSWSIWTNQRCPFLSYDYIIVIWNKWFIHNQRWWWWWWKGICQRNKINATTSDSIKKLKLSLKGLPPKLMIVYIYLRGCLSNLPFVLFTFSMEQVRTGDGFIFDLLE